VSLLEHHMLALLRAATQTNIWSDVISSGIIRSDEPMYDGSSCEAASTRITVTSDAHEDPMAMFRCEASGLLELDDLLRSPDPFGRS
jgi:hypothetical protein